MTSPARSSFRSGLTPVRSGPPSNGLAYAVALAGAAERMADAEELADLWPLMTREALALVDADGAAVLELRDRVWRTLAVSTFDGVEPPEGFLADVERTAVRGLLLDPGASDDLQNVTPAPGWRSVLAVAVDRRPSRAPTRLLWYADRPSQFAAYAEAAELFARHAGVAARAVTNRTTLSEAVASRHRIGQAQGIMIARYRLTAEQAFDVLRTRSQYTNVKLRSLAEQVIATGRLPGEQRSA